MANYEEKHHEVLDGYNHSQVRKTTIVNNGFFDCIFALGMVLLMLPIGCFLIGGSVLVLRMVQGPVNCPELPATRSAQEFGRN